MHPRRQAVIDRCIKTGHSINFVDVGKPAPNPLRDVAIDYIQNYTGDVRFIYKIQGLGYWTDKQLAAALRIMVAEARDAASLPQPSPDPIPPRHVMMPIHEGRYTIVLDEKRDLQYTIWITKYRGRFDMPPDTLSVKVLIGPDNTRNYMPCAFIYPSHRVKMSRRYSDAFDLKAAIELVVTGDSIKYGEAYALKSRKCWRCRRDLTRAQSIKRGLGPDCAAALGI